MFKILIELIMFYLKRKRFLIIPLVLTLVFFGALLVLSQGTVFSPFVYTLF